MSDEDNTSTNTDLDSMTKPAADVLFDMLLTARNLGMKTAPTEQEPHRVITAHSVSDLPSRVYALVQAIENLEEVDPRDLAQIMNGAVTILRLKIALHAVLGWIAARGLPTKEVSQMVVEAVRGPIDPSGSAERLNAKRAMVLETMGNAAPAPHA